MGSKGAVKGIVSPSGKTDLVLTKDEVILNSMPIVKYDTDVNRMKVKDIKSVGVTEMEFTPTFALSWIGVELGLLLIFFGLTRLSIPLFDVFAWYKEVGNMTNFLLSLSHPKIISSVLNSVFSLVLIVSGIILVPMFDDVTITLTSKDGKTLRYLRNYKLRPQFEEFKTILEDRIVQ